MFIEHLLYAKHCFKRISHISPQILPHNSRSLIQITSIRALAQRVLN